MTIETGSFSDRLARLERENRRLKFAARGLVCALIYSACQRARQGTRSAIHAGTLDAKEMVLRDNNGRVRLRLTAGEFPGLETILFT